MGQPVTSHGLILYDAAINIAVSNAAWNGVAPTYPALANYMGRVREMSHETSLEATSVKGGGALDQQNRYHTRTKKITLKGVVCANGFALKGLVEVGHWMKVSSLPLSTMATPIVEEGVITNFRWSASEDSPQLEEITIDTNAVYTAA